LKAQKGGGLLGDSIKWNFAKFLVDKNGNVVDRYAPTTPPSKIEVIHLHWKYHHLWFIFTKLWQNTLPVSVVEHVFFGLSIWNYPCIMLLLSIDGNDEANSSNIQNLITMALMAAFS
jgi:hypothetical protein